MMFEQIKTEQLKELGLPTNFGTQKTREREKNIKTNAKTKEEADECFNKIFSFKRPCKCSLPDPYFIFQDDAWENPQLQEMKKQLNSVKNKLNFYNLDDWHKHTRATNRAGEVLWKIKKQIQPELLTQAWCKFYEIASRYPVISEYAIKNKRLNSVHLCEAPGAFITSLNHFLKIHYPDIKWDWTASTLNPYYEGNPQQFMIDDDRFIFNTLEHWNFGVDFSGNLMDIENMKFLVKKCQEKHGEIHLVTADGSIDCQEDPGEQEYLVSSLNFWETFTALHLLEKGGTFILKMFTLFESDSCCLLFFLWNAFHRLDVFKPVTSKEGNSEIYIICLDYKGSGYFEPWLTRLTNFYEKRTAIISILPQSKLCPDFMKQLVSCADYFKNLQIEIIERNINLFEASTKGLGNELVFINKRMRFLIGEMFFTVYHIKPISENEAIVGKQKVISPISIRNDVKSYEATFIEKKIKAFMNPKNLLEKFREELLSFEINWKHAENVKWFKFFLPNSKFEVKCGKSILRVESSKFCHPRLLQIQNQVCDIVSNRYNNLDPFSLIKNQSVDYLPENCGDLWRLIESKNEHLEFNVTYWLGYLFKKFFESQEACFPRITEIIDGLWRDNSLILSGFPLLTQFNYSLIYVLGHMFESVGFVKPQGQNFSIILYNYNHWNKELDSLFNEVKSQTKKLLHSPSSVIGFVNIKDLCQNSPCNESDYYNFIIELNNLYLKENLIEFINQLLSTKYVF